MLHVRAWRNVYAVGKFSQSAYHLRGYRFDPSGHIFIQFTF